MIHPIKLAGVKQFWVISEADAEDIDTFVKYYEAKRLEGGYIPILSLQQRLVKREEFMDSLRQQFPDAKYYARTDIEYWIRQNERSARWLWRQIKKHDHKVLYSTVTTWCTGEAEPQPANRRIVDFVFFRNTLPSG